MLGCSRGRNTSYALFLVLPTGRSLLKAAGESPLAYSLGMDLGRLQLRTGLTLYDLWHTPDVLLKLFTTGKDSLLDQTLARLLKFLLHYLCHFFFLRSSFSKNLAKQFNQTLPPPCLITLIYDQNPHPPPSPKVMSHLPGLSSARIPLPLMYPLSKFPLTGPHPALWLPAASGPHCIQNWAQFCMRFLSPSYNSLE